MLPLARHLQARPLQGRNHRGAIRDGPRFDALAQIVGNQPPGVFLCRQPGPKLGGLDVRPMAGLHVTRPLRIVRTTPAVLVVLPVPQCVKRLLPSGSRDIQALAGLKIAARRQDMHVDTPARFAVLDRCPGVAVRFEARPGGFLELVHHSADLRIARVVLRCPGDDARRVGPEPEFASWAAICDGMKWPPAGSSLLTSRFGASSRHFSLLQKRILSMKRHRDEHDLGERWSWTHDEFDLLRNRTDSGPITT